MFEKIRILGELAKLQAAAGTSRQQDSEILYIARNTAALENAIAFSKNAGPKLGAIRLVLELCEITTGTNGPRSLTEALRLLFIEAEKSLSSLLNKQNESYVPARILHQTAMAIKLKMLC